MRFAYKLEIVFCEHWRLAARSYLIASSQVAIETTLLWFRQDLRITDNPALAYAVERGAVIPVYIYDVRQASLRDLGAVSKWWLHESLQALSDALDGKLLLFKGDPEQILARLIKQYGVDSLVWNRCYEPWQMQRDTTIKAKLSGSGVHVKSFNGFLLWEPWQILKQDGTPYKVFTPFYRRGCLGANSPRMPVDKPKAIQIPKLSDQSFSLGDMGLLPDFPWHKGIKKHWNPGEEGAKKKLQTFIRDRIDAYKTQRDIPGVKGTSRLSPHLHFGEISPNQIWYAVLNATKGSGLSDDLDCYMSELGWREFSYYLLYHYQDIPQENFQKKFDRFKWRTDSHALKQWQKGQTGIPIIDAGMRELWQTGFMHNRVRMIVASFLVKNLLIHWKDGEAWFWDCLVDADLASNVAGWQWVAGSGADAAPYFRIFNPVSQGKKFDPEGEYVLRYCPELRGLQKKFLHQPWEAPEEILREAQVVLGTTYPKPMADLKQTRQRALDAFADLKNG